MKHFVISILLLMPLSVFAAGLKCSIRPSKDTPISVLPGLATVSQADAQKTALVGIKAPSTAVAEGELEVEQGCLVYSFDIRIPGKSGVEEVMVDAGTGKIISHKHETQKQEQAERAKERRSK